MNREKSQAMYATSRNVKNIPAVTPVSNSKGLQLPDIAHGSAKKKPENTYLQKHPFHRRQKQEPQPGNAVEDDNSMQDNPTMSGSRQIEFSPVKKMKQEFMEQQERGRNRSSNMSKSHGDS